MLHCSNTSLLYCSIWLKSNMNKSTVMQYKLHCSNYSSTVKQHILQHKMQPNLHIWNTLQLVLHPYIFHSQINQHSCSRTVSLLEIYCIVHCKSTAYLLQMYCSEQRDKSIKRVRDIQGVWAIAARAIKVPLYIYIVYTATLTCCHKFWQLMIQQIWKGPSL